MKNGGTTFNFITDGIESALSQAQKVASSKNISIAGGASTIQQFIKAELLDELHIHMTALLLGDGTRLFDSVSGARLEKVSVIDSPLVTHFKFRLVT